MSAAGTIPAARVERRRLPVPLLLFIASLVLYVGAALYSGQLNQLNASGVIGLLQRMVGLGIVALGQTFVILAGSIDLSVANLISVAAVMASFVMQGDPGMIVPAILLVLAISVAVGAANGLIVAKLGVNPLIATLGVGLILQGLLSASFNNFAGSVPEAFQGLAYGAIGGLPWSVLGLFALALVGAFVLRSTRFGAHLYATGGNPDGARLAGIRTD
ncbi:MAG: ABC transporter permease, partial [Rhizobiales bacterium]|nr:ABC transporter permease [Hyphomicrobiales bacterium]